MVLLISGGAEDCGTAVVKGSGGVGALLKKDSGLGELLGFPPWAGVPNEELGELSRMFSGGGPKRFSNNKATFDL
jgi:hypothetical protein